VVVDDVDRRDRVREFDLDLLQRSREGHGAGEPRIGILRHGPLEHLLQAAG
jgi:hypothetical protein